jgi:hypothetical protein
MSLIYTQTIEGAETEYDFIDRLVETCAENFFCDGPECDELNAIRETIIANRDARDRLCALNPRAEASYRAQHDEQMDLMETRIMKLKMPEVKRIL